LVFLLGGFFDFGFEVNPSVRKTSSIQLHLPYLSDLQKASMVPHPPQSPESRNAEILKMRRELLRNPTIYRDPTSRSWKEGRAHLRKRTLDLHHLPCLAHPPNGNLQGGRRISI
jgi:hypothetical protein